jgi:hypothetical protein
MTVTPRPSRKIVLGFLPLMILLVGQLGFRAADTIMQASTEVAPQESWEKAQWQDAQFLSPSGWKVVSGNKDLLTLLPDSSEDSDKVQITLSSVPNEDFGLRRTLERYVRQEIGNAKPLAVSTAREVHYGAGYDGLVQRVTTQNNRGEKVYDWYFIMDVAGQNRMLRFTAESTERQTRYQKDFNRFLNNLTFDAPATYQGPAVTPADYYEGRQIAASDDPSHG